MPRTTPLVSAAKAVAASRKSAKPASVLMTTSLRPPCYARRLAKRTQRGPSGLVCVGDRAERSGRYQLHVLGEEASRIARLGRLPLLAPRRELFGRHIELDEPLFRVNGDRVAFLDQRDGSADISLRRYMADHHAPCAAREAAIREQADRLAEPLADQRGSRS